MLLSHGLLQRSLKRKDVIVTFMNYLSRLSILSRSCSHRKQTMTLNTTHIYIYIYISYDSTSSMIRTLRCDYLSSLPLKPTPCTIPAALTITPKRPLPLTKTIQKNSKFSQQIYKPLHVQVQDEAHAAKRT